MKGNEKDVTDDSGLPQCVFWAKIFMFALGFDGCCYTAFMNSFQLAYPIVLPIQSKNHHRLQHQSFQHEADPENVRDGEESKQSRKGCLFYQLVDPGYSSSTSNLHVEIKDLNRRCILQLQKITAIVVQNYNKLQLEVNITTLLCTILQSWTAI